MLLTIGIIYFIYILTRVYLSVMEIGYISKVKYQKPVILLPSNYMKAANYKISSQRVEILSALMDYVLFIFWIGYGLGWLERTIMIEDIALKSVVFILAFLAINYLASLPFSLYQTFVLDKKYGFSNMDAKLFVSDLFKSALLTAVFGGAIIWILAKIILNIEEWWLLGFGVIFAVVLIINLIYPTFIAPLFNKFTPLEDEDLRSSIEALMQKVGLKSDGVYTMDASKRDNRLNAYFGGLGRSKRVVLFDTLVKKLTKNELLAVLGHELGHYTHKDIWKNIFMMGMLFFIMFYIFGHLPQELFGALRIPETPYAIMAIFLLFSPVIMLFYMPLMGIVSRHNEYEADKFGASCQNEIELANALQKLANENKTFPKSHPIFIFFYYTHPPLVERLKRLGMDISDDGSGIEESCPA